MGFPRLLRRQGLRQARVAAAAATLHPPLSALIGEALAHRDAPREHWLEEILPLEPVTLFDLGDVRLLSGNISEALVMTKFELAIAIPVLVVQAFLVRRVRAVTGALVSAVMRFVNVLQGRAPT